MKYEVDTLIVGGGPAGAACGITLQKRKVSNLILDRAVFPRPKTCGGLMTQKTWERLLELLPEGAQDALADVVCDVSTTIEIHGPDGRLTRSELTKPLRSVRRLRLDDFLIRQYRALGGTLLEGQSGYSTDYPRGRTVLKNGDEILWKHLVAADGALSKTRAALGCRAPSLGFCAETYVPKQELPAADAIRICFGETPTGYVWVFPSGGELCVGLGGVYDKKTDYPAHLRSFLSGLGCEPGEIKGAFVPIGSPVPQKKTPENVLLIGDAGGFVDPLYGEGLYYALTTGILAGRSIADGGGKKRFLKNAAPHSRMIRQGERVQKLFFRPRNLAKFLERIRGRNGFAGYFCDRQLAAYSYPYVQIWRVLTDYRSGKRKEKAQKER